MNAPVNEVDAPALPTRRRFLQAGAALGGGLVVGYGLPAEAFAQQGAQGLPHDLPHYQRDLPEGEYAPTAYVRIARDGQITVLCGKAEMGQGVHTGFAQIVADELDADWRRVRVEQAPVHLDYANPNAPMVNTGGSTSIRANWTRLRLSGATARAMLVSAAARRWNVDAARIHTRDSVLLGPGGLRATYGEMAEAASREPVPTPPLLKSAAEFKHIGKPLPRLDTPAKTNGSARYSLDVKRPGLLTAVVAFPPAFGARARAVDSRAALALPGVRQVVQLSNGGVAVVAEHMWAALQGRQALVVEWTDSPLAALDADALRRGYAEALDREGIVDHNSGDVRNTEGLRTLTREFDQPFLAQAPMEPLNCTVHIRADAAEVWVGTQNATTTQRTVAAVAGLRPEQVTVHTTLMGGAFGRRGTPDFVQPAAEVARATGRPVKLVYTREDDMKSGYYRPMSRIRVSAGLDAQGRLAMLSARIAVPSIAKWTGFAFLRKPNGVDLYATECLAPPYRIPNLRVEWVEHDIGVPIWFWRTPGGNQNCLPIEAVIDEMADLAGQDPYRFRRDMLADRPRHRRVLDTAAQRHGWDQPPASGVGRGIAMVEIFGSVVAIAADVREAGGLPAVQRVSCAVDCGTAINPQQVRAQMQSSIVYGLSALLYGGVEIDRGVPQASNFHDQPVLRLSQMPRIEVDIVPSEAAPGGVGEPALPPLIPAVVNAWFRVTGKRVQRLPIGSAQ